MIVGLCSSYLEGPLVKGALRSLIAACDKVICFEGPAGPPLEEDVPESDFEGIEIPYDSLGLDIDYGRWSTDAKKRTRMIESLRPFTEPTWGVWIDGDEQLMNPAMLRDWLQFFDWKEEETGTRNMGWPIKIVEMDGSVAIVQAKVLRVDRLDSYSVSSSVFRNVMGELDARGNYRASIDDFPLGAQVRQLSDPDGGYMFAWDSFALHEPYIIHRSKLRHPRRQGLRLHEQEAEEIKKAKIEGLA